MRAVAVTAPRIGTRALRMLRSSGGAARSVRTAARCARAARAPDRAWRRRRGRPSAASRRAWSGAGRRVGVVDLLPARAVLGAPRGPVDRPAVERVGEVLEVDVPARA